MLREKCKSRNESNRISRKVFVETNSLSSRFPGGGGCKGRSIVANGSSRISIDFSDFADRGNSKLNATIIETDRIEIEGIGRILDARLHMADRIDD